MPRFQGAGPKRRRVTYRQPDDLIAALPNTFGEPQTGVAQSMTLWSSVEPLLGRELWNAQQVQADITHRLRTRYSAAAAQIDAKWKALYGQRAFEIVSCVSIDERRRELELLAKEITVALTQTYATQWPVGASVAPYLSGSTSNVNLWGNGSGWTRGGVACLQSNAQNCSLMSSWRDTAPGTVNTFRGPRYTADGLWHAQLSIDGTLANPVDLANPTVVPIGVPFDWVMQYAKSQKLLKLWINGTLATIAAPTVFVATSSVVLPEFGRCDGGTHDVFQGWQESMWAVNFELTDAQVATMRNGGQGMQYEWIPSDIRKLFDTGNPVTRGSFWPLGDGGNYAVDLVGGSNGLRDGALQNGATFAADGSGLVLASASPPQQVFSNVNQSTDSWGDSFEINLTAVDAVTGYGVLKTYGTALSNSFAIKKVGASYFLSYQRQGGNEVLSTGTITLGTDTTVAVDVKVGVVKFYINGVLDSTQTQTNPFGLAGGTYFGADGANLNSGFVGKMRNHYSFLDSQTPQVYANLANRIPPPPLTVFRKLLFNETSGTKATDSANCGNMLSQTQTGSTTAFLTRVPGVMRR